MSWREKVRTTATFRGVPFVVESAELGGGRRTVTHEYPLRNEAFVEDMGRRARSLTIDGFVLGEEYLTAKERLQAALEQDGPGELVHPYYGTRRVKCSTFRIRESSAEGGMARFSMDLEETLETAPAPASAPDVSALVSAAATGAREGVVADFVARYSVTSAPEWAVESLAAVVTSAAEALDSALGPITTSSEQLASLRQRLGVLAIQAAALVRRPAALAAELVDVMATLVAPLLISRPALAATVGVYSFTPSVARPDTPTSTREREQENYDAVLALVRRVVVIEAAEAAPGLTYESHDQAVADRESITELLDEELEEAGDESFPALQQLRAELVRGVPGEDSALPRLVSYTPPVTTSSLVLAYQLYGDLALEADIVSRNSIAHPGVIRGGEALEVLSRG